MNAILETTHNTPEGFVSSMILTASPESQLLECLQIAPVCGRVKHVGSNDAFSRLIQFLEISRWSILQYLVLQEIARWNQSVEGLRECLEILVSKRRLLLPGGLGEYTIDSIAGADVRDPISWALEEGLAEKGIPSHGCDAVDAIDIWDFYELGFSDDSLYFTERGIHEWLVIESFVLGEPITRSRRVGDRTLVVSSSVPMCTEGCFFSRNFGVVCPLVQVGGAVASLIDECSCGVLPNWRADWWRRPQRGFFVWCAQDPDTRSAFRAS